MHWLIVFSGVLIDRFHIGPGGRTNRERLRGQNIKKQMVELRERVLWMPLDWKEVQKLDTRYCDDIFLCVQESSDEIIAGTA